MGGLIIKMGPRSGISVHGTTEGVVSPLIGTSTSKIPPAGVDCAMVNSLQQPITQTL